MFCRRDKRVFMVPWYTLIWSFNAFIGLELIIINIFLIAIITWMKYLFYILYFITAKYNFSNCIKRTCMHTMIKGLPYLIFLHSFGTYFTEDDFINKT